MPDPQRSPRRALAIAHHHDYDPGVVGERLEHHGFVLQLAAREDADPYPPPADVDIVVALGSAWMVGDERTRREVMAEQAFLRAAVAEGVPVLGICFGAQQLAAALGGTVQRSPAPEIGWVVVDTDDAGAVPPGPWMQFHDDAVSPPPGAEVVARNDVCVQAFRLPGVLAVQFHPEVTPATVDQWLVDGGAARAAEEGIDVAGLRSRTAALTPAARASAHQLVDTFLRTCPDRRAGAAVHRKSP